MDEQLLHELDPAALRAGCDYDAVALRNGRLTERGLDGVAMEGSLWSKVGGAGVRLGNLQLTNIVIRDCDLANARWENARLTASRVAKTRLTGWNVSDAVLRDVEWVGCKVNLAVLHGATLRDCRFEGCDLREADFQGARLRNVVFGRCDLRAARFAGARLEAVDFRGSHVAGIYLDAGGLRGNVFDPSQLVEIAQILGLVIKDPQSDDPHGSRPDRGDQSVRGIAGPGTSARS